MNAPRDRPTWRRVDGVLLLDKPSGLTSNAALQRVRRLYRAAKAGHSGTLDPLATGLLPCLFGEATKFGSELLDADKTYQATIALGVVTTTGDAEGEVVERRPVAIEQADLERALERFRGLLSQVPPMYSALKHRGRPLYEYARAGERVERTPREVTIHELTLIRFERDRLDVVVRCSKGTYVRCLAEDLGRDLGCGASLAALRRTGVGRFSIADAVSPEALERLPPVTLEERLLPMAALVAHLAAVTLAPESAAGFRRGQSITPTGAAAGRVRVHGATGDFIGIGQVDDAGVLRPLRLLRQEEPAPELRNAARIL